MNPFLQAVQRATGASELSARALSLIQVNLGLRCNLECRHCHVAASPRRQEMSSDLVLEQILDLVDRAKCSMVDLTGGAPELHPQFRPFVVALRQRGVAVQTRSNLAVFSEPHMADLPVFLRDQGVRLVASMPCYLEQNVDAQRGSGSYQKVVSALKNLNILGYGLQPELGLDLVYNPSGPFLPPQQAALEADYRRELANRFGLSFSNLRTITNMPIGRFRADLRRRGQEEGYWNLLRSAFNPATLEHLMCRSQVNVGWDGTLYDCDFNFALNLPIQHPGGRSIAQCDLTALLNRSITTAEHCFGCTAGCGSSCNGALAA